MYIEVLTKVAQRLREEHGLNSTVFQSPKSSTAYMKCYFAEEEPADFWDNVLTVRFSSHSAVGRGDCYEHQYESMEDFSQQTFEAWGTLDEDGWIACDELDEPIKLSYEDFVKHWAYLIHSDLTAKACLRKIKYINFKLNNFNHEQQNQINQRSFWRKARIVS